METVNELHFYYISTQAWEKFGKEKQMHQLQEELAELIVAISHHLRGRDEELEELAKELADVLIVINQLVYGLDIMDKLNRYTNQKLTRLESKLK